MANRNVRLTTKTRQLRGTARKDRPEKVAEFESGVLTEIPKMPGNWPAKTKRIFDNLAAFCFERQLITRANVYFLQGLAIELFKYGETGERIAKINDPTNPESKVLQRINNSSLENAVKLSGLFGIDPNSAKKIGEKPAKEKPHPDSLEDFLL